MTRVWLPHDALDQAVSDARDMTPDETGGVLLGYWAREHTEAVITSIVGPGPRAEHRSDGFRPDPEFHEDAISHAYRESAGRVTYLGDWHSHPTGLPVPSEKDRRVLRRIAREPAARAPRPLMLILGCPQEDWELMCWQARPQIFLRVTLAEAILRPG